jgi:hypothetical protein
VTVSTYGGTNNFVPVLSTPAAPATGTYYISVTVMAYVVRGDGVDCLLGNGQGVPGAIYINDYPVASSAFETLPLGQAVPLTAGETLQVYCGDYTANSSTEFYDGAITGTLINSATGNVTKLGPVIHHPLSPRPHSRLPKHDEFRVGHLHTSSFRYAAVIDDIEHREASIRDQTPQSVDGLCDGLAAGFSDDPSEDCVLSSIRLPFELRRSCARLREQIVV